MRNSIRTMDCYLFRAVNIFARFALFLLLAIIISNISEAKIMGEELSQKEKHIAEVSSYAAAGDIDGLKVALSKGLDVGVKVNEFKEVLVQLYAYCGFPRSLNAISAFMEVLNARGGKDELGPLQSALPSGKSIDFGTENQTKLVGMKVKGSLFDFAPAIDEYLKAHLFGDIFSRDNLDWKTREIATIAMLASMKGVDSQLNSHIAIGKHNGLSDAQVGEILKIASRASSKSESPFALGKPNDAYSKYFSGKSWLAVLASDKKLGVPVANVTFEPSCRNNWHSHTGGQILIAVGGVGYYQERGKPARRLCPGDVVEIAPNVEHWHGAAPDSFFSHLAIECNPQSNKNTWLEPVSDADYKKATSAKEEQ